MKQLQLTLLLLLLLPQFSTQAQSPQTTPAQQQTINHFLDGYNRQDFKEIRSTFSWVFKRILSKKTVGLIYGAQFKMLGPAHLVRVRQRSARSVYLELAYASDTTEHVNVGLSFTKKNRVIGLGGSMNENYEFPKTIPSPRKPEDLQRLTARIDSMMQVKSTLGTFNGCVLVVEEDRNLLEKCYGYADFASRAPLNETSMFELASCSKQFTAMGIMMLVEQGKLNYTDDVRTYIPEFPYEGIHIEDLLIHTSGLPEYEELLEKHWDKTKIAGNADVIAQIARYKPKLDFNPGTKHEYSNTGYVVLSILIERISGLSYGAFLDKQIFQPLGMTRTRVYNTRRADESIPNYAWGYVRNNGTYTLPDSLAEYDYVRYLDAITGDGTVNSCVEDLAKWEQALRENRLVSAETLKKAHSVHTLPKGKSVPYGYGWEIQEDPKFAPVVYHSGSWPGYITYMLHFQDRPTSVIILSNDEYLYAPRVANRIAKMLSE